jgi:hypothetical protein
MPGRNGRGPLGQGPLTGRRAGRCGGMAPQPDTAREPGPDPDCGSGRGKARRHRNRHHPAGLTGEERGQVGWPWVGVGYPPALRREQELPALRRYAESLERTLDKLKARIQQLEEPRSP